MIKSKFKYISLLIAVMMLVSTAVPLNILGASVDDSSKTVIKLTPGVGKINVNGITIPSEKPYKSGNTLYIPLRTVMEAFGADVVILDNGKIGVLFKNVSAELAAGKKEFLQNQVEKTLSSPPVYKGKTLMVPSDFVTKPFDISESTNKATGQTSFTMENDGALTDLSFLTGSLNKPRAGNSYFGWSLAIPKGSIITAQTFNSKYVQFENDYHGIAIEISVQLSDGKSLGDYYDSILENPYKELKIEPIDSRITPDGYIELFYTDSYDEAIYHRIYSNNGYFYNLIITSFDESDPEMLLKDKSVSGMLASFRLDYKGGGKDTSDLAKVSYGLARYSNYIVSENTGKKFASWEMSILPEWDQMASNSGSPYITKFGTGAYDYVSIETSPADEKTAEETGKSIKSAYEKNFNPALFNLKNAGMSEFGGISSYSMTYEVKFGKTLYTYVEKVLVSQDLAYDITFRTTKDTYDKKKESFDNMLKTFKPYGKDAEALSAEMEKYSFNSEKNRLGKDDRLVSSENKSLSWSITLPGNWKKSSYPGSNIDTFTDDASMGIISIEAVSRKSGDAERTDEEKFYLMSMAPDAGFELVKTDTIQVKGRAVKVYKYRIDNEETDDYADVTYYVLDGADYQYCYMSSLPDLTSSEGNLKILADAWASFIIAEKNGDYKIMLDRKEPLAYRMSPRTIEEFVGQEHITGRGKMLYRMIKADRISSIILYGPPGTGKTSLARIIAATTKSSFEKLNAVTSGVADIKRVVSDTQNPLLNPSGRTVLFIDEIHRFNKSQQDALLPYVENGTIVLIGATTENPFFEVNKALISRSSVFMLKPLTEEHIVKIVRTALADKERGLGSYPITMDEDALKYLAAISNGDARAAMNAVELAAVTSDVGPDGSIHIDLAIIEECVQKKAITFDKSGEAHYDNISAFIKSMRGSSPDAAIFYLARALYAGEDPEFLARRIVICASEDVGMANSNALPVAVAAAEAVRMIGMPEARIMLAHAAVMVATSPKSNSSYMALSKAMQDVETKRTGEVPMHLRNAPIKGMEQLGYGIGYKYAHDYPGNIVRQEFLPAEVAGTIYYEPTSNGFEARIKEWLDRFRSGEQED